MILKVLVFGGLKRDCIAIELLARTIINYLNYQTSGLIWALGRCGPLMRTTDGLAGYLTTEHITGPRWKRVARTY